MIKVVVAKQDKETKSCFRYNIKKNDKGISGVVYLKKDDFEDPPESIKIKIKIED